MKSDKKIIEKIENSRVYVSVEEWDKLSIEAKIELISLSQMTGDEITENLPDDLKQYYNKICYDW